MRERVAHFAELQPQTLRKKFKSQASPLEKQYKRLNAHPQIAHRTLVYGVSGLILIAYVLAGRFAVSQKYERIWQGLHEQVERREKTLKVDEMHKRAVLSAIAFLSLARLLSII